MLANVIPLWGFVCTKTCLHAQASALLIHHEKHPSLFTSGEDCHGGLSLTEAVNVFLRDHDLQRRHCCLRVLTAHDVSMTILARRVYPR